MSLREWGRVRIAASVLAIVGMCMTIVYGKRVYYYFEDTHRRRQQLRIERVSCPSFDGSAEAGIVVGGIALPLPGYSIVKREQSWALVTDGAVRYMVHTGPEVELADEETLLAIQQRPAAFVEYLSLPTQKLSERRLAMTTRAVFATCFPDGIQVVECPDRRLVVGMGIGSITATLDSPSTGLRVSLLRQRDNIAEPLEVAIDRMVRALAGAGLAGPDGLPP